MVSPAYNLFGSSLTQLSWDSNHWYWSFWLSLFVFFFFLISKNTLNKIKKKIKIKFTTRMNLYTLVFVSYIFYINVSKYGMTGYSTCEREDSDVNTCQCLNSEFILQGNILELIYSPSPSCHMSLYIVRQGTGYRVLVYMVTCYGWIFKTD